MTSATTPAEINMVVLITIKAAMKLYLKTGIKANRAYTPANMLAKATEFTGVKYKRGQLQIAHDDLQKILDDRKKGNVDAA